MLPLLGQLLDFHPLPCYNGSGKGVEAMNYFCPFIRDYCRKDCVFWCESKSTNSNCRIDAAAVNLEYLGDLAAKSAEDEAGSDE